MRNESAHREADHARIVSSIKREAESAGWLARDEFQHQHAEALHSAQTQLEELTAERDAANSALQAAEENAERITKQAAARNSQVNITLKSKDMEMTQLRAEQQRLQDLLTSSEDFQALLQMQLVSSREQKHSEAFDLQRHALCEARNQISLLSPEVHNLREQVNKLNAEILAQKTMHEQALSEHGQNYSPVRS
jgi:chromosome segregation ATPase